jgi:ABC-type multidrug transport system permease subunit
MSNARVFGSWMLLALLMSANGAFRELVLRRAIGTTQADLVSAAIGALIILGATWYLFRPLANRPMAELARVSAILVALTVAFEFLAGRYVDGKSWEELIADYAIWRGRLLPALLLIVALTPFLWGRWMPRRAAR